MRLLLTLLLFFVSIVPVQGKMEENRNNPVCIIKTSMGDITAALFVDEAPKTVSNFIELAEGKKAFTDSKTKMEIKRPFYDNLVFHRVIKDFMIQGGCPTGNGKGGPGYKFKDEINAKSLGLDKIKAIRSEGKIHPHLLVRTKEDFQRVLLMPLYRKMGIHTKQEFEKRKDEIQQRLEKLTLEECYENLGYEYSDTLKSHPPTRGVIAMANSGPNTNGSQFFINMVDTPWLTGKHTVFGKVIKGMDVVDKIGSVPVDKNSKPDTDVKILSIRLYQQESP